MSTNAVNTTAISDDGGNRSKKNKKKRCTEADMKEDLHQFSTVAQSANKVLTQFVNKQKGPAADDKNWDFAKHIYNKMREIPDGYVKDDMQLEIQQLIAKAKKQYFYPQYNMPAGYNQGRNETHFDMLRAASQCFAPTAYTSQPQESSGLPVSYGTCQELKQHACNSYTQL